MSRRILIPCCVVVAVIGIVALAWMQLPAQAQTPPVTGLPPDHTPADPSSWQRGEPLPGETYPWTPADTTDLRTLSAETQPDGYDLDVTYIHRAPMYHAYCVQYPGGIPTLCAGTENEKRWPDAGEVVTFTAHIINKGNIPSPDFAYQWAIDGSVVMSGTHAGLAPAEEATVTYQWSWAHTMDGERVVDDHRVRLIVETATPGDNLCPMNDSREDRTNALVFTSQSRRKCTLRTMCRRRLRVPIRRKIGCSNRCRH